MAEPTSQDEGIAALDALSEDIAEPQEKIIDPIVEAAKAPAGKEANIEPVVPRPIVSPSRTGPTRLQLAEKGLDKANQGLKEAKKELSDAARAAAEGAAPTPTLVEMNALARKQQVPESRRRRQIQELITEAGLTRRPYPHPTPKAEATVQE